MFNDRGEVRILACRCTLAVLILQLCLAPVLSWLHTMQIVLLCCGVCGAMRVRSHNTGKETSKELGSNIFG